MRTTNVLVVMLGLTACVTGGGEVIGRPGADPAAGAGQPSRDEIRRLDDERAACGARLLASSDMRALSPRLSGGGGDDARPTPIEAAQMDRLHHDYLRPCQEIELEIAGRTHPSLPPLYNEAASKSDAVIARLVRREITWSEYGRATFAIRQDLNARLRAAKATLGLPTLNQLDRPGSR